MAGQATEQPRQPVADHGVATVLDLVAGKDGRLDRAVAEWWIDQQFADGPRVD
ncbi:hypothetical protein D3C80_2229760 [compost metagenome]